MSQVVLRFWNKVEFTDTCWLWRGYIKPDGYGSFAMGSRADGTAAMRQAHRVAWEMQNGPIPDGLEIDHLCKVRHCVNPGHLEPVTHAENIRRGRSFQREQTHCKRGHEFTEANTYPYQGKRACKTCRNEASRRYRVNTRQRQTAAATAS